GEVRRQVRFQRNSGKDPTKRHKNGCWMLDVGCWLRRRFAPAFLVLTNIQHPTSAFPTSNIQHLVPKLYTNAAARRQDCAWSRDLHPRHTAAIERYRQSHG